MKDFSKIRFLMALGLGLALPQVVTAQNCDVI